MFIQHMYLSIGLFYFLYLSIYLSMFLQHLLVYLSIEVCVYFLTIYLSISLSTARSNVHLRISATNAAESSSERSNRAEKRGLKRTIQDVLSEAEYDSRIGRCDDSDEQHVSATEKSSKAANSKPETTLQDVLHGTENEILESDDDRSASEVGNGIKIKKNTVLMCKKENEQETSDISDNDGSEILLKKIKQLEEENRKLQEENGALKASISDPEVNHSEVHDKIENILKPIFSKTQIDAIISKRSVRHWPDEDISAAFTLRSMSPKCYEYLRTKKGIPLPCKSTLNERAKNFACEPGILHSVLSLMKTKSDSFSSLEKLAVISLDEMSIASEWSYDKGKDILYKPHDKVQVVMLSGLVGKWKQPIYYDYDVSNMQRILLTLIEEVELAGYPVVAIVHDLGSSNLKMWKDFGIDPVGKKTFSFKNPSADRNIFVFADVPHMIKLIRNNFLDSGFYLHDGSFISDSCIREMMTASKTEYGLAYKLNEMHVNVWGQQRQRVKYAVQLLSKTCSSSLKYLGERGLLKSRYWKETAAFISLVDEWFDVLNSSHKFGAKQSLNAFGINLDDQSSVLHRMIDVMTSMRVKNPLSKGLYKFQKGVILSSQSLLGLYKMLQESFNLEYILTRNLNQDSLEHFFGCIRQMRGTYDHPNAVTFKYRVKNLLLGKDVALLSEKQNTTVENYDCLSHNTSLKKKETQVSSLNDRQLAIELYMTSQCFKDLDTGHEINDEYDDFDENLRECVKPTENASKTIDVVIEEESLKYIGGYIVKKFCLKYPDLGLKATQCNAMTKTWTEEINRGDLYVPSESFFSQLTTMREVFKVIHGDSLKEGKDCFKTLVREIESVVVDVPHDVISFFAKISVYFKIRKQNNNIKINKKKEKVCRSENKKLMKLTK